jgi:hypothetical protein
MRIKTAWPGGMVNIPDPPYGLEMFEEVPVTEPEKYEGLAAVILGLARNYKKRREV